MREIIETYTSDKRRRSSGGKIALHKIFMHRCFLAIHNRRSQIFCASDLMHDVQMASIYQDSKTFVDKKLKFTESEIMENYTNFKMAMNNNHSNADLKKFVNDNFEDGDELELWSPPDFTTTPSIAERITDQDYKKWALSLNEMWKLLGRKIKEDVKQRPELYSIIYVPNGFCIPGGRFKELYYWDTYWIVNGLLLCDMKDSARGIIENIMTMVNRFGFMPNGNRVYYLNRSQPPLLILMVFNYYQSTKDFAFIKKNIDTLMVEFEYWMTNKMVKFEKDGKVYKMARYYAPSDGPRPESYREDYEVAHKFESAQDRSTFYTNIKSGAETGWDFSTRWFMRNGEANGTLRDINTSNIIPVDLNAFLHASAVALSAWCLRLGYDCKARRYRQIADELLKSIKDVLWREDIGIWLDYDLENKKSRDYFYVSNITPLWTGSYNMPKKHVSAKVIQYLIRSGVIAEDYSVKYFGTPSSMQKSSEQWDFPNAWPPLQAIIVQGLDRTNQRIPQIVAFRLAQNWLQSNHKGYVDTQMMYEKYNSLKSGETGGGGEYVPQTGFGWTNGVVLEFLDRWGTQLTHRIDDVNGLPTAGRYKNSVTEDILHDAMSF